MRMSLLMPLFAALFFPWAAPPQPARPEGACPGIEFCQTGDPCDFKETQDLCKRYEGPFLFESAEGLVQGSVLMRQWQIANDAKAEIPHQGLLIVHLRAGALTAEIGDDETGKERQEWREGAVWSVPAKKRLTVYTARESVVLQTVDIIEPEPSSPGGGREAGRGGP